MTMVRDPRRLLADATPRPWEQHPVVGAMILRPGTPDRKPELVADDLGVANAALIVAAVNEYEGLLDLKDAAEHLAGLPEIQMYAEHDPVVAGAIGFAVRDLLARLALLRAAEGQPR